MYRALKIPSSRLDPQDTFKDGQEILREELKFARFIIRMQQQVAAGFKNGFITHLQLKGLWSDFKLKEQHFDLEFNVPTNFYELRESQKLEMKVQNFGTMSSNQSISPSYAQKKYLGWSDIDVKANREFLRKDKEFAWELAQIEQAGPNWRQALQAQAAAMAPAGEIGGGAPMAGGGGGGSAPPPFVGGPAPIGGEAPTPGAEAPAPEGAPEAGAAPTPEAGA